MPLRNPYATPGVDDSNSGLSPTKLPTYVAWNLVGFVKCWLRTRHLGLLLQGLPAIVLAVLLASLLISHDQPVSSQTIETYLDRAEESMGQEEFDQAEFYFRKLEKLAPDDRRVMDSHADLFARQGDYQQALRLKEALVSDDDKSNDVKVHQWLARTAMEQDVGIDSPLDYAKEHLVAVLNEKPDEPQAHYFFARLNLMQGDIPNAIEHLEPIASYSADVQLQLASLYLQLDPPDRVRAEINARNAATILRKKIRTTQTSDVKLYHQLGSAYVILEDFEDAIQTLREAETKFDLAATRRQMARSYVAWSDQVRKQQPDDLGRRMSLLEKALQAAPNEPLALQRMLEIASADGEGAEQAEQVLRKALVEGVAPAAVHFSLGTLAAKRGDTQTAMMHFQQSAQLNPRTAVTLNNMAYIMAQTPEADLHQALEFANQAVSMAPSAAPFRDTRGQILTRLKRWSAAIADLEYANSRMEDLVSRMTILKSLTTAYRGLGDEQTASAYQQKYEELAAEVARQRQGESSRVTTPDIDFQKPAEEVDEQAP